MPGVLVATLFPIIELAVLSTTLCGRIPFLGNVDPDYYYPLCFCLIGTSPFLSVPPVL